MTPSPPVSPVAFQMQMDAFLNSSVCVCVCACMYSCVCVRAGCVDAPVCPCPCDSVGCRCDILDSVVSC